MLCGSAPPRFPKEMHEIRNVSVTILVDQFCGVFQDTQIGVNFAGEKPLQPSQYDDMSIALHTLDQPSAVVLYPYPVTHQKVVDTMYPDSQLPKTAPQLLSWMTPAEPTDDPRLADVAVDAVLPEPDPTAEQRLGDQDVATQCLML
jgi:hypothetical protein